ncbi:hypothetical protein H1R20_g12518, partial [Candolleomyces eurysporus]
MEEQKEERLGEYEIGARPSEDISLTRNEPKVFMKLPCKNLSHCRCCPEHSPPKPELKTMPCGHKMNGRNLIVCIDGTANQFGDKNTNVIELYNLVMKEFEDNQFTWYNSGIGTYARPHWRSVKYLKKTASHKVDLAIAWHFDKTILGAYRWLSDNYQKGDCIFLFGFSRGAFQVRTLSGMIHKVGLIHKGNEMQIPLYAHPHYHPEFWNADLSLVSLASQGGGNVQNAGMDRSRPPSRWMITEAEALGLRLRPFERELTSSEQIEFRESLKGPWHLFELLPFRRLTFARSTGAMPDTFVPHLWAARKIHPCQKIHSSLILSESETPYIPKARPPLQEAAGGDSGVNSDGGGLFRSLRRLRQTGTPHPELENAFWENLRTDGLANSNGWLEIDLVDYTRLLLKRLVGGADVKVPLTDLVSKYDGAQTVYDETMETIRTCENTATGLKAKCQLLFTIPDILEGHWQDRGRDSVIDPLHSCSDAGRQVVNEFLRLANANSRDGAQAVYDGILEAIRLWEKNPPEPEAQGRVLRTAIEILGGHLETLKLRAWSEIRNALADIWRRGTDGQQDVAKRFLDGFTADINHLLELTGHSKAVTSISISPDNKRIVSSSGDNTIQIWDLETGKQVGEPLSGHTKSVMCVAISPDGKRIVSGSDDHRIRIWDAATGAQVGEPLQGHELIVWSVAISPDGKHIVSGSDDRTIRVWDLATGKQVGEPLRGHTSYVFSVAISPDGKRIVSGSLDNTVRIWNAEGILV